MPRALIIQTAGTNCDHELAHAFQLAGAKTELIHINRLIENPDDFDRFDLLGFPGGFSYGDDVAAGKMFAVQLKEHVYPSLLRCLDRGVPMFAVCNGFQILVKLGLLPGPLDSTGWPQDQPPAQTVTLAENAGGRFIDNWVKFEVEQNCPCIWTRGLSLTSECDLLPVAHAEGRFVADEAELDRLEAEHLVAMRYSADFNLNGSMRRIAGICDPTGLVFGLMPHPERIVRWTTHPYWTRLSSQMMDETVPIGLQIFQNAVRHASKSVVSC